MSGHGDEGLEYKAFAALFGQMRSIGEKTIANFVKSAQATPMSEQSDVSSRRYAELWA
jgi:hypothetical protein